VSRFALMAFGDLFTNLKKYMDVDLDIATKTILQKNSESNDFIRLGGVKTFNDDGSSIMFFVLPLKYATLFKSGRGKMSGKNDK
jgi:hypothetical protein